MVDLVDGAPAQWGLLLTGWLQSLQAKGRTEKTRVLYRDAGANFANWLITLPDPPAGWKAPKTAEARRAARRAGAAEDGTAALYLPRAPDEISKAHIERFLIWFATTPTQRRPQGRSDSYLNQTYRALQQWFLWMIDEDEIDQSPMERMSPPKIAERLVPILALDQLTALVAACSGRSFRDRRDAALIRVFADCGGRRSEVAGIQLEHLDLTRKRIRVIGKGDKERLMAVGTQTALALNRYLRVRGEHRCADLPWLWLSERSSSGLTSDGVYQAITRRGEQAGVEVHPHMFRHTLAHEWLDNGGGEQTLADHMGWNSTQMAARYGAIGRSHRAQREHERLGLGDRIETPRGPRRTSAKP